MDKEVAKALLAIAVSLDTSIGKLYDEANNIYDDDLKSRFNRSIGDLMGHIARELIFPIVDMYPDLDPDK